MVAGNEKPVCTVLASKLPNGMKLRRSKIRGVESNGMLCSAIELGLGDESDGIVELPGESRTGQAHWLNVSDCRITSFDLDLTPNRGDCFSVLGHRQGPFRDDVDAAEGTAGIRAEGEHP